MSRRRRRILLALACLGAATLLEGCGRKGGLEGPAGTNLPRSSGSSKRAGFPDSTPQAAKQGVTPPKTSFFLDPLL